MPLRRCSYSRFREHKGRGQRRVLTSLGEVQLQRAYIYCSGCRHEEYAADELVGVRDYWTARLRHLACLAGADKAFEPAALHLREFLGVTVSAEKVRLTCHAEAKGMIDWHEEADAVATTFRRRAWSGPKSPPARHSRAAGARGLSGSA